MTNIDDFDQFCSWAMKPNELMEQYQILETNKEMNNNSETLKDSENDDDKTIYRVRSFKRTQKGVVNQGDKVKPCNFLSLNLPGRSKSFTKGEKPFIFQYNEKESFNSLEEPFLFNVNSQLQTEECCISGKDNGKAIFEIYVIGKNGVGKTSLCEQFSSSDSFGLYKDANVCEQNIQKVTVDLDDVEWTLNFHDFDNSELSQYYEKSPDAYILVYSIDDNDSFNWCSQHVATISNSAIFIVGNKSDLERLRQVSLDKGKRLAEIYAGKFFEVSTILNHMVDNLLVQIIIEILRQRKRQIHKEMDSKTRKYKKSSPGDTFLNFFRRLSKAF